MIRSTCKSIRGISMIIMSLILLFCLSNNRLIGQYEVKKKKARISLDYINKNKVHQLRATIKTKVDRSYQNVPGVNVYFYYDLIDDKSFLGKVASDNRGESILKLPKDVFNITDSTFEYTFIASIENDPDFGDKEKEISIRESVFKLVLNEEDSEKTVKIFVGIPDETGEIVPIEDVNVKLFVRRLFGNLLIGEDYETTDADGNITFEFPSDIPGDKNGDVEIIACVEDDDDLGNLEFTTIISWGIPVQTDVHLNKKELWSAGANAPIPLVLIVSSLVIGIWGVIFYTIVQTFKIWRLGKENIFN